MKARSLVETCRVKFSKISVMTAAKARKKFMCLGNQLEFKLRVEGLLAGKAVGPPVAVGWDALF